MGTCLSLATMPTMLWLCAAAVSASGDREQWNTVVLLILIRDALRNYVLQQRQQYLVHKKEGGFPVNSL